MEPAAATSIVRAFLVSKFCRESDSAVTKDIFVFFCFLAAFSKSKSVFSLPSYGLESEVISPSFKVIIRVAYSSANSGLCVTITTSLVLEISFKRSIIWTLVSESSAPVGSSASKISGLFTKARAMATLCICPPDS